MLSLSGNNPFVTQEVSDRLVRTTTAGAGL